MPGISLQGNDELRVGERFSVSFERTLRIPDDGRTYPLPPGLGRFPIRSVKDYLDRVPADWLEHADAAVFIPMYQREALWLAFDGAPWKPDAVQIAIGGINVISGDAWEEGLNADPQNYIVSPDQPWLDGINAGEGYIRQFVAMPLGEGYTLEAQLSGNETQGGIQIRVYEPKEGRFPDEPQLPTASLDIMSMPMMASPMQADAMGLGAGGKIKQQVFPDPYGLDAWDPHNYTEVFVYIVNSEQYKALTGLEPPPTPISASTYTEYGFPWFDLYAEDTRDLPASTKLAQAKSIRQVAAERGANSVGKDPDDQPVEIDPAQVKKIKNRK